ncbi:MAG: hypothetical protein ACJAWS_003309 [Oleiphilaceae bacterium]
MKIFINYILAVLVFLAMSWGTNKVMLMQQDVAFFGAYGFTHSTLIIYGIIQLTGDFLLALRKTRALGALVVAITFTISWVMLFILGNVLISIITLICIVLLGFVNKLSLIKF